MRTIRCAAFVLFATSLAAACTCVPSLGRESACQDMRSRRTNLFVGKVDSIALKTASLPPDSYPVTVQVVTFRVVEDFGGKQSGEMAVTDWVPGNGSCGFTFAQGHTYLVDASVSQEDSELHLNSCGRTAEVSEIDELLGFLRSAGGDGDGTIFGTVKEFVGEKQYGAERNRPVEGATVILDGTEERTASTDSAGWYVLRHLSPSKYVVRVNVPSDFGPAPQFTLTLPKAGCAQVDFAADRNSEQQ